MGKTLMLRDLVLIQTNVVLANLGLGLWGGRSHEPKASGDDVDWLEELLARQRTTEAVE